MIQIPRHNQKLSLNEFFQLTQDHQQRVHALGLELFKQFNNHFEGLTDSLVYDFLKLHDLAKTERLQDGTHYIENLYQFYGKNKSDLEENDKFNILKTINNINYWDTMNAVQFFHNNQLILENGQFSLAADHLLLIEKISDLVDRGEHILSEKEFNKKLQKASLYLSNKKWAEYAYFLEQNYLKIIENVKIA